MAASLFTSLVTVAGLLLCCSHLASGFTTPKPKPRNPFDSFVGTSCRPPFGFRPNSCGAYEILTEVVTLVPVFLYGPNTCRFLQMIRVNELEYEYRRYCDWTYSRTYRTWVQQCQLICQPTRVCSNRNQTIEVSNVNCCPGFQTRPRQPTSHYNYYRQQHFTRIPTEPEGCPISVGESIADCLRLQNLTRFLDFVDDSIYRGLIYSNDSGITVLAPTNAAFDLVDPQLLAATDVDMLVGNHILPGLVSLTDLQHTTRVMNVIGLTLHSTLIHFPDYSLITYLADSQYTSSSTAQFREMRFINGAAIENADACRTDNGTLHIINRVLMPSAELIVEQLQDDPQFSMFVDALEFAGTLRFLNETGSHTIFVPNNDAFQRAIPPDLFTCLTSFERVPLTNLVLYHISRQTDYTQVLGLRQSAFTLFNDYKGPRTIVVVGAENGTVFLGELGEQIPIIRGDIPASNGVIHEIDGVLMPPNFNYGQCQRFVPTPPPTTPPPTTQPPTTAAPTTEAPTTISITEAPTNTNVSGSDYDYSIFDRNI